VEPPAYPLRQQLDEMPGGRAGAQAEPHAGPNELEGAGGGGAFLGLDVHHDRPRRLEWRMSFIGKPVPTFPGHALTGDARVSSLVPSTRIAGFARVLRSPAGGSPRRALPSRRMPASDRAWFPPPWSSISTARWSTPRPISSPPSTSSLPARACRRFPMRPPATWSAAARG